MDFTALLLKLVIFTAKITAESHFCTETIPKTVEIEVSPKQEDSVPCLELYKSVSQSTWLYDEERMHRIHGGDSGVNRYFGSLGALAECFTMKSPVTKRVIIQEKVQKCCEGWTGDSCDLEDTSDQFDQNNSSKVQKLHKFESSKFDENSKDSRSSKNNRLSTSNHQFTSNHQSTSQNLDRLRGLLNSAGIYVPKYQNSDDSSSPNFKLVTCLTWNNGYIVTFDKRSYTIDGAKCWYQFARETESNDWSVAFQYRWFSKNVTFWGEKSSFLVEKRRLNKFLGQKKVEKGRFRLFYCQNWYFQAFLGHFRSF